MSAIVPASQREVLMRSIHVLSSIAVLTAGACGDPLMTAQERGDPLFSVRGTVTKGLLAGPPAVAQEVGVLWLNVLDDNSTVLVEVTPADAIGNTLPAAFDVSVLNAPSDRMLGKSLIGYDENGNRIDTVARDRVGFGVVVVAPEGTFASLPESTTVLEFISAGSATPGPLLQSFTYVSPFAVGYVRGADTSSVTYRDINGVESLLTDFTIFDISTWARDIDTAVCRDSAIGEARQAPEVQQCIVETSTGGALFGLDRCEDSDGDGLFDSNPGVDCYVDQGDIESNCVTAFNIVRADEIDAICGVRDFGAQGFRRVADGESLTLTLGDGDIRRALTSSGLFLLF